MKRIDTYILEKLHINKDVKDPYNYHPKDKEELIECIKDKIEKEGLGTKYKPLNLNDIYTGDITDMSYLFNGCKKYDLRELSRIGYFNISDWDVSNVKDMSFMFAWSNFNGDISRWNVNKVKNMKCMFDTSNFTGENGDISNWDVSNVTNMALAFYDSPLEFNHPKWYKE